MLVRIVAAFGAALCLSLSPAPLVAQANTASTAAAGSFTDEQAGRGEAVYKRVCSECHAIRDHSNEDFKFNWKGRSVLELFNNIRNTMPEENPGSLSAQEYADIVAYMMKVNGMVAGSRPLLPDTAALRATKFDVKESRRR